MTRARRLGRLAKGALLYELALYPALVRWVLRRPDVPQGATAIGYDRLVGPMLWLWIFGSATEVVVVDVVLRQVDAGWAHALQVPMLLLGVWGVVWMLGMRASMRVTPHLLTDDLLRVRSGARTWLEVPRAAVASARPAPRELPGTIRTFWVEDGAALVGVGSETNLELVLTGPTALRSSHGEVVVDRVGLFVDDPRDVAALLRVPSGRLPR